MKQLEGGFNKLGLKYIASNANFISVKVPTTEAVYNKLLRLGVIVRVIEIPGFIRISVGEEEENKRLINCLEKNYAR